MEIIEGRCLGHLRESMVLGERRIAAYRAVEEEKSKRGCRSERGRSRSVPDHEFDNYWRSM